MQKAIVFGLIGGLGMFLLGMQIMSEGLQKAAGKRLRRILEIMTSKAILGVLAGAGVTAIIQSSSATTVMTVGFVNAGLMTLRQAIGVIMGANIGTTITAQLLAQTMAFDLGELALPAIGVGFAMSFMAKNKKIKYAGQVLLGFGLLFYGMDTMKEAVRPLRGNPDFINIMATLGQNPFLGILAGIVMTAMVQSSSATIAILISLASAGLLDIHAAIPILFGDNIGTTVTAILATLGTNTNAKRTAVSHALFNIAGTIIFMVALPIYTVIVLRTSSEIASQIANAHTLFNISSTLILLPFVSLIEKGAIKLVPGKPEGELQKVKYIDENMLKTPSIALAQVAKETVRIAAIAQENVRNATDCFLLNEENFIDQVTQQEELVDQLEEEVVVFLAKLAQEPITLSQSNRIANLLHAMNDIERVSDHAEGIVRIAKSKIERQLPFSEQAINDLKHMFKEVDLTFAKAVKALNEDNIMLAEEVVIQEDKIDLLEKRYRKAHIQRMNEGKCCAESGIVFLDIISNYERIGDHATNIAHVVIENS